MALSGTINGNFRWHPTDRVYPFIAWFGTQSIAGNYTDVWAKVYFQKVNTAYYFGTSRQGRVDIAVGGSSVSSYPTFNSSIADTVPILLYDYTFRVYHNADGTKSVYIGGGFNDDDYTDYSDIFGPSVWGATVTLDAIPRKATVTSTANVTVGNNIPLTITNNANLWLKATFAIWNGSAYVNIKTQTLGQVTSGTFTFDAGQISAIYAEMPNVTSANCRIRLNTYADSGYATDLGYNDKTGTASIDQTANKPTFTTFTLEQQSKTHDNVDKYTNTLVSSDLATLTDSTAKFIKGYSKVRAIVTSANKMVALNSATAVKYRHVNGSQYKEENYSADSTVNLDIDNVLVNSFAVTAYDSRSLTTTVSGQTMSNMADYAGVTLYGLTLTRTNDIDAETTLSFEGTYWKQYFGGGTDGTQNTITAHYRFKETTEAWDAQTWNAITVTDTDGALSFSDTVNGDLGATGFDADKSFNIEVRIFDKITNAIVEGTLSVGTPVAHFTKNGIALLDRYDETVGGSLQVDTINVMEAIRSGWFPINDTWTYASATTITVPSGATSLYEKGAKIRYKQGGSFKYANIINVADALLTITGGTGYVLTNSAITDISYSNMDIPLGFPGHFDWTPVVTGKSSMTWTSSNQLYARFSIYRSSVVVEFMLYGNIGGTMSDLLYITTPVKPRFEQVWSPSVTRDTSAFRITTIRTNRTNNRFELSRDADGNNYVGGVNGYVVANFSYYYLT